MTNRYLDFAVRILVAMLGLLVAAGVAKLVGFPALALGLLLAVAVLLPLYVGSAVLGARAAVKRGV